MDYSALVKARLIVVVVQLPNGAMEVITNTENLEDKYMYYLETYDENMIMYNNENIKIVDWIIL